MRLLRAACVACPAAVALLVLAGCTNDEPSPREPVSSATSSGSPGSPTSSATPDPVEPELPEAATKATEEGARAFITYYWDVVNYAQASGDVKMLGTLSAPTCDTCAGFVADVRQLYRAGGEIIGGANRVRVIEASELSTSSGSAFGFRLEQVVSHAPQTIVEGDGSRDERGAGTNRFTTYLLWVDETRWRIDVMELR